MAHKELIFALSMIVTASPVLAAQLAADENGTPATAAPAGGPDTRYCMRVEPQTGSRIESVECWTREEWAAGGVDVDKDWPKEGVRVLNG
jgi:hypothetical protein